MMSFGHSQFPEGISRDLEQGEWESLQDSRYEAQAVGWQAVLA